MSNKEAYEKHLDELPIITMKEDIRSSLSSDKVDELYDNLMQCLPNGGKLYKYRNFKDENNSFKYAYDGLKEGYLWLASPSTMNDKIDSTLFFYADVEIKRLKQYLIKNKTLVLTRLFKALLNKNGIHIPFSNDTIDEIVNCYNTRGKAIKSKIKAILRRNYIPYNKFVVLENNIANFIEQQSANYEDVILKAAEKFKNINVDTRNKQKMFCVAESYDIESMWAYYGDESRGFCIEYDFNKGKGLPKTFKCVLLLMFKVKYANRRKQFTFIDMIDELVRHGGQDKEATARINKQIYEQITLKNKAWQHEKEWRLIVDTNMQKLPVDIVSAIYIDESMISTEKGQMLVTLAQERNWRIYKRSINYTHCKFEYKRFN